MKNRFLFSAMLASLLMLTIAGCVEQIEYTINSKLNIVVVDGRITNLAEEQIVRLFRSRADSINGRFGSLPIRGATMEVIVNGTQTVAFAEDPDIAGNYRLPAHFKGEIGNTYQLKFRLPDGATYLSEAEKLSPVPPMENLSVRFVPDKRADFNVTFNGYHEIAIDFRDPADERNFYTWEWNLYEKQIWCRSCVRGVYAVNKIIPGRYMFRRYFVSGDELFEDCFVPPPVYDDIEAPTVNRYDWTYDYNCRTQCWEVLRNTNMNLFDDSFISGGQVLQRKVANIPFYQRGGCLVEMRQLSFSKNAYDYYRIFQQQIENGGGIADTPPTVLRGNMKNIADDKEVVVGYFSASAVSSKRQWIDRRDTGGVVPPGLYEAMNGHGPNPEPDPPYEGPRGVPNVLIWGGPIRVPTAICIKSNNRTPQRPEGWIEQ